MDGGAVSGPVRRSRLTVSRGSGHAHVLSTLISCLLRLEIYRVLSFENAIENAVAHWEDNMNKTAAIAIKTLALAAVENLSAVLLVENIKEDPELYKRIHRAIGTLIGQIEVDVLSAVYKIYPDLNDL